MYMDKDYNKRKGVFFTGVLLLISLFFVIPSGSYSQFYNGSQMTFGKNRVQYKEFFWTYYKFENYDIYFYLGGKELAIYTAKYVKENLTEIEDRLDTGIDDKMQFIIFNTYSDLNQSNIGLLEDASYNTGGVTQIIGKKILLYFDGNHRDFDRQIKSGLAQVIVNQLLYGSTIGAQIKNTSLFPFPDWYMNGLVSYISEDWNTEIDNRVKDGILTGEFARFNQLTGEQATVAGHAFWNYISEKYGSSTISNIIYMAKVSRRLESGFLYVLGKSFSDLVNEATAYYKARYSLTDAAEEIPEESLLKKIKSNTTYSRLRLSPDGKYAAYTTNQSGQYKVFLKNLQTGKVKKIMKGGYRLDEKVDYSYPLLAWHPMSSVLSIIVERKGEIWLYFYYPGERKMESVILYQFEKVLDFSYSDEGSDYVMSAVQRGNSDIFIYNIASNSFRQITKDYYDDLYPRFVKNSTEIIWSSNRNNDTLRFEKKYKPGKFQKRYDLFLYDLNKKSNILRRVTKTPLANEIKAMEYDRGYITFLSDENGIYNRYIGEFDSTISFVDTTTHYRYFTRYFPITDYSMNIIDQDVIPGIYKYGQIIYKDRKYRMQILDQMPPEDLKPVSLKNTVFMDQLVNVSGERTASGEEGRIMPGKKKRHGFYTVKLSEAMMEVQKSDTASAGFDINNYQFNKQGYATKDSTDYTGGNIKVALPGQHLGDQEEPTKRLNYNVEYFLSQIVTQIDFSYLNQMYQPFSGGTSPIYLNPGFNALLKIGVMDLMEDYRITGGVRLNLNLVNNEYLFSYANLKKRLDKEIVFHRNSFENYNGWEVFRIYSHELFYKVTWPFSRVAAVKGTLSYRNDMGVYMSTDVLNLSKPNEYRNWAGFKGEFVFDNTKSLGLNLYQGTRYKIFGEYYQLVDKRANNLVVLGFDFRNYQKIHRTLIWANRFAISTSFGNNKLIYYMGGVDNWLWPKFNVTTPIDYSQNYAYQTLATNMRGFPQNIRNGNSFAVFNTELRFPVFRYLANRPIKSDFLNNFQIVGFGDVGTAWTGLHPYSDENFLYTKIIEQNPMRITVRVQKDPIVGGFGFGARTRLLGYFLRADVAWGVEDLEVLPAIFYFSLSLDF